MTMNSARFGTAAWAVGCLLAFAGCGEAATGDAPAAVVAAAPTGTPNAAPATVAEAAQILDLRKLPLVPGSDEPGARTVARLTYHAKASPRDAYIFHRQQLLAQQWTPTAGEYIGDDSASGTFIRDGYALSTSTSSGGRGDDVKTTVVIANHGNLTLSALPQPANSTLLYDFPVTLAYATSTPVDQTAAEIDAALLAAGWEPYGAAGNSRFYRQMAIRLTATTTAAPAQDGKTVVSYSTELISAELPAPADAKGLQYSEPPVQLALDFSGDLAAADQWYREQLGKIGWEPTTDHPVKQDFTHFVIYRNKSKEMLEVTLREMEDFTRLLLRFTTAEEFEEMEKRWDAHRKKLQAEAEADK
jgi:hypothetical protein